MKIISAQFLTSAGNLEACPAFDMPEFAFIGRSNVGKSSLINMLVGQEELAKTSSTPGKTQLINFFTINASWNLVDLPGYGFAKVAKRTQMDFNRSVGDYFIHRDKLEHLFVLIDPTIPPQEIDLDFLTWLKMDCALQYSIVFTKVDKISKLVLQKNREMFIRHLKGWNLQVPQIFCCSAKDKRGRGQILQAIEGMLPKKTGKKKNSPVSLNWIKGKR